MASTEKDLPARVAGVERKWWVLLAIGIGAFMSALDGSVVNTILPIIRNQFNSGVAAIEWVVVVYLLVVSGLLLTFGRLGDLRGHKTIYISGFAIFVFASALCGLASSTTALVAFRGVQALGAAVLLANSPAILTKNFPATQRGQALGLQGTMIYLGLTVGPSLGGWLAQHVGWRSVFYINIPVGLAAFLLSLYFIPQDKPSASAERFDVAGALAFMAGLTALMLSLNRGAEWGWGSPAVLGLLAASFLLLAAFIAIERRIPAPMLDLSLFRRWLFSAGTISAVLNYVSLYGIIFLMPFYLIQGRGLDPARAGLVLTAQPLVMAVAAPLSGAISDRIGSRLPSTLAMLILSAGLFMLSRLGPVSSLSQVGLALAVAGLGTGMFASPNTSALMGAAPRNRQGIAAGVLATARNVGMVLGIGMAGAFLATGLARSSEAGLYTAISAGLLAASATALLGALTSAIRGKE